MVTNSNTENQEPIISERTLINVYTLNVDLNARKGPM